MLSVDYIHRFISSLVFTSLVETAVSFLMIRFVFRNKELPLKSIILTGVFASFATIPYVWFVFPYIRKWPRQTSLYFSDPFAFLVETIFYRAFLKTGWGQSLLLSLAANLTSYFLGPLLRSWGLWIYW